MERHTCKLCYRRFSNGRALGGHMRSHVTAAGAAAAPARPRVLLLPDSSASSASMPSAERMREEEEEEEEEEDGKGSGQSYGLRENPRKSFKLVDPEFSSSFAAMDTGSSAVLQDRESETESPRAAAAPCHGRRSKRPRPAAVTAACPPPLMQQAVTAEPEPVSSVSDATPEEDVAISLMILSRDVWAWSSSVDDEQQQQQSGPYMSDHDDDGEAKEEQIAGAGSRRSEDTREIEQGQEQKRSRFQCETCKKVFKSYQALGGHRASHKKMKQSCAPAAAADTQFTSPGSGVNLFYANADRVGSISKVHECPVCFRVFGSGQALGGHKRSHLCYATAAAATTTIASTSIPPLPAPQATSPASAAKSSNCLIDLNLPAPMDEDAADLSAVSDADFVAAHNPHP